MTKRLIVVLFLLLIPAAARAQDTSKEIFVRARAAAPGSAHSIALYQRYTRMEPDDAWGFLALAESLAAARRFGEADAALRRAETLAPGDDDVVTVRARVERSRRASLPSVKPVAYLSRDTDANKSVTIGAAGDVAAGRFVRAGITGGHTSTGDGTATATIERGAATLVVRSKSLRWTSEAGAARLAHVTTRTVPVAQTHLRWSGGARGFAADVRVRHNPLTSVYALVAAEAMLTEARGLMDIPLFAGLKVRANGQVGSVETNSLIVIPRGGPSGGPNSGNPNVSYQRAALTNQRTGFGGGLVMPYSPVSEFAITAYRLQYDEPGSGEYFAPEYVDALEAGTYAEIYRFDPVTVALDAGVGMQRAKAFGQPEAGVKPAYRLWSQVTVPLGRYVDLNGEVDYYKSQLSTVATSASWSSLAGGVSLRWLVR